MKNDRILGIHAPPPQATILAAAMFAATVTFPIGVVLLTVDLLLL